jgi:hypothetical protein
MPEFRKKKQKYVFDAAGWEVRRGQELLAVTDTEALADLLIGCLERGIGPEILGELPYGCDVEGPEIKVELRDASHNLVEGPTLAPGLAAAKAFRFVLLHGADPDEGGRGAQEGTIHFEPMR